MESLTCQATDCMHNLHNRCSAKAIQINNTRQETFCDTYTKDTAFVAAEKDSIRNAFSDVDSEFGAEFIGAPKISCNVSKCAYNQSFHCKAPGVQIEDPHGTMMCSCKTYRPK